MEVVTWYKLYILNILIFSTIFVGEKKQKSRLITYEVNRVKSQKRHNSQSVEKQIINDPLEIVLVSIYLHNFQ